MLDHSSLIFFFFFRGCVKTIDCAGSFSKYSSGDYKKCRESIELWLLRYQTTGTLSDPAALLTNDPTPGSLHHCHTAAEPISAGNSHCWHRPRIEKNEFRYYPEPFQGARPACKTPCCSSTHSTQFFFLLKMTHADAGGGGNHP